MSETRPITVAVDAVGGDHAPEAVLEGVRIALAENPAIHIALVGPADIVEPFAASAGERVHAVVATEVIEMDEHPANAVRTKKDSSIVVGSRLVKDGEADAFFSAGSTGACMAAATLVMGRIKGVLRPAIATILPTGKGPVVLLDAGANADCKPENLLQFAHMGVAYAASALGIDKPRVGLLNIGEEPTKGSQLAQDAHVLLAEGVPGFAGNAEGRDVMTGEFDVLVTDGFTGNVVLKLLEGTSKVLFSQLKSAMTSSPLRKLAAAVLVPAMRDLKGRLDPEVYGGAPLLGIKGVSIIGHGSSSARAIASGIVVGAHAAAGGLTQRIADAVAVQPADAGEN